MLRNTAIVLAAAVSLMLGAGALTPALAQLLSVRRAAQC